MRIRSLMLLLPALILAAILAFATSAAAAPCQGAPSCGTTACTAWSAYYDCDAPFCGGDSFCDSKGTDAVLQPTERYRACTLPDGSQCLEFQHRTRRLHCGCGGLLAEAGEAGEVFCDIGAPASTLPRLEAGE
jgi:hypothetical protein